MQLFKEKRKETHLYSRWAYKRGGGAYIRNKLFVGKWMGLYPKLSGRA